MMGQRIDFPSTDPAGFNQLRDQWRSAASGCALSKAGLRVATVLPGYVSREFGYAFPTDEDLAGAIGADKKTVKRGLTALDSAHLIERQTMAKRDDKGAVVGKMRRIYLSLPKGHSPKGQPEPKGQKCTTEGTYGCPYIPDRTTPDKEIRNERKVSSYVPAREDDPIGFRGDTDFLDTFDRIVTGMTDGSAIGAGETDRIVQQAFDQTTDSSELFMPVHWREVCALRSSETGDWFRRRAGQLIHRMAA